MTWIQLNGLNGSKFFLCVYNREPLTVIFHYTFHLSTLMCKMEAEYQVNVIGPAFSIITLTKESLEEYSFGIASINAKCIVQLLLAGLCTQSMSA